MLRARARYKARMCTLQLGLVPVTQREAGDILQVVTVHHAEGIQE